MRAMRGHKGEVTGEYRKLQSEDLHTLQAYCRPNVTAVNKQNEKGVPWDTKCLKTCTSGGTLNIWA